MTKHSVIFHITIQIKIHTKFLHGNKSSHTNSLHLKLFINFNWWELVCLFQPNFAPIKRNSIIMKFSELPWLMVNMLKVNHSMPLSTHSMRTFNCDRTESRWGWDRFVFWLLRNPNLRKLINQLNVSMQGPLYSLHNAKFKEEDNPLWTEGPLWKVSNLHSFKLI